jgi:ribosome biogenesis GTPase
MIAARHTTVHRELFTLPDGGLLIDTPGLKLVHMPAEPDAGATDEIMALSRECRFVDCRHETEPDCAVQAAIADGRLDPARLQAARKMTSEAAWAQTRSDPPAQRARGRDWRRAISAEQQEQDT